MEALIVPVLVSFVVTALLKLVDQWLAKPTRQQAERKSALDEVAQVWDRLDEMEDRHKAELAAQEQRHEQQMEELRRVNALYIQRLTAAQLENELLTKEVRTLKEQVQEIPRLKERIRELEQLRGAS
ncbi:MAG TPA: hypothetical protein VGE07_29965 [Herpetosiphonaceae bacterium]